jgi:hypothetical protein
LISGIVYAFYFRKQGPQQKEYSWEEENENEDYGQYWLEEETNEKNDKI